MLRFRNVSSSAAMTNRALVMPELVRQRALAVPVVRMPLSVERRGTPALAARGIVTAVDGHAAWTGKYGGSGASDGSPEPTVWRAGLSRG
jgi:hypothetical protein